MSSAQHRKKITMISTDPIRLGLQHQRKKERKDPPFPGFQPVSKPPTNTMLTFLDPQVNSSLGIISS